LNYVFFNGGNIRTRFNNSLYDSLLNYSHCFVQNCGLKVQNKFMPIGNYFGHKKPLFMAVTTCFGWAEPPTSACIIHQTLAAAHLLIAEQHLFNNLLDAALLVNCICNVSLSFRCMPHPVYCILQICICISFHFCQHYKLS